MGVVVSDRKQIAGHYLRGTFAIDLLANLPIDALFLLAPGCPKEGFGRKARTNRATGLGRNHSVGENDYSPLQDFSSIEREFLIQLLAPQRAPGRLN